MHLNEKYKATGKVRKNDEYANDPVQNPMIDKPKHAFKALK